MFRRAAFSAGNAAGLLSYAALFGLFFLMPFVFVRVYRDSILVAGLRLSIVPVMLGMVAPIGGALYNRLGARLLTASGMLICAGALTLLFVVMDGAAEDLLPVMVALALFGVGQGLFISPSAGIVPINNQPAIDGPRPMVSDFWPSSGRMMMLVSPANT